MTNDTKYVRPNWSYLITSLEEAMESGIISGDFSEAKCARVNLLDTVLDHLIEGNISTDRARFLRSKTEELDQMTDPT